MPLALPSGKRLAVSIGADFDAHCVWMGTFALTTPGYLSRGEFGAEVGVPRLLALFGRLGMRTTFCIPSHTLRTFPQRCAEIITAGHEVAAHGCYHEQVTKLDAGEERRLMEVQLAAHEQVAFHPQTIARAHAFLMFERFVDYVIGHDDVWIAPLGDIAATWYDDESSAG